MVRQGHAIPSSATTYTNSFRDYNRLRPLTRPPAGHVEHEAAPSVHELLRWPGAEDDHALEGANAHKLQIGDVQPKFKVTNRWETETKGSYRISILQGDEIVEFEPTTVEEEDGREFVGHIEPTAPPRIEDLDLYELSGRNERARLAIQAAKEAEAKQSRKKRRGRQGRLLRRTGSKKALGAGETSITSTAATSPTGQSPNTSIPVSPVLERNNPVSATSSKQSLPPEPKVAWAEDVSAQVESQPSAPPAPVRDSHSPSKVDAVDQAKAKLEKTAAKDNGDDKKKKGKGWRKGTEVRSRYLEPTKAQRQRQRESAKLRRKLEKAKSVKSKHRGTKPNFVSFGTGNHKPPYYAGDYMKTFNTSVVRKDQVLISAKKRDQYRKQLWNDPKLSTPFRYLPSYLDWDPDEDVFAAYDRQVEEAKSRAPFAPYGSGHKTDVIEEQVGKTYNVKASRNQVVQSALDAAEYKERMWAEEKLKPLPPPKGMKYFGSGHHTLRPRVEEDSESDDYFDNEYPPRTEYEARFNERRPQTAPVRGQNRLNRSKPAQGIYTKEVQDPKPHYDPEMESTVKRRPPEEVDPKPYREPYSVVQPVESSPQQPQDSDKSRTEYTRTPGAGDASGDYTGEGGTGLTYDPSLYQSPMELEEGGAGVHGTNNAVAELSPRLFKYLPANLRHAIPAAGKRIVRGYSVAQCLSQFD